MKKKIRYILILILSKIFSIKSFRKIAFASLFNTDADEMNINGEEFIIKRIINYGIKDFIDVGANCGKWTKLVIKNSNNFNSMSLYEPNKLYNSQLNRISNQTNKIKFYPFAISGNNNFVNFKENGVFSTIDKSALLKVKSINYKTLLTNHKSKLNYFIKIDTEGSDLIILEQFFKSKLHEDSFFQIEFGEAQKLKNITLKDYQKFLPNHLCFVISKNKLLPLSIIDLYDFCTPLLNIFFIPGSKKSFLKSYDIDNK